MNYKGGAFFIIFVYFCLFFYFFLLFLFILSPFLLLLIQILLPFFFIFQKKIKKSELQRLKMTFSYKTCNQINADIALLNLNWTSELVLEFTLLIFCIFSFPTAKTLPQNFSQPATLAQKQEAPAKSGAFGRIYAPAIPPTHCANFY